MVAGVLAIAPALQILALLGATYSLYLLFVGTPKVMHAPHGAAINYFDRFDASQRSCWRCL